jgi:hypothetical protein
MSSDLRSSDANSLFLKVEILVKVEKGKKRKIKVLTSKPKQNLFSMKSWN